MRPAALSALVLSAACAAPAFAHVAERGPVLLLPTGYYLSGGALAVAATFVALALLNPDWLLRAARMRVVLARPGQGTPFAAATSLLSFAVFLFCVVGALPGVAIRSRTPCRSRSGRCSGSGSPYFTGSLASSGTG